MNKNYIIPLIIIIAGSIYVYLENYKSENYISLAGFGIILLGWMSFIVLRDIKRIKKIKKGATKKSIKYTFRRGFIKLTLFTIGLIYTFLIFELAKFRKEKLWSENEKISTYAQIIKIEKRKDNFETKRYLIFKYITEDKNIIKEIRDENENIKVGDSLLLKYVRNYPELYRIEQNSL